MKVLVMFVNEFGYKPAEKNLEQAETAIESGAFRDAVLAFIHVEEEDEDFNIKTREKKLVNYLKWACRKNNCQRVILHSFAHLSSAKASPAFTHELLNFAESRLNDADFEAVQTPFGYFLDLSIKAPGYSLARMWAEL
ncbi:MAG: threonyl-tRNA synthetase editing domain-containing protein [Prolixibacteraceae bacterium]|nr:threonyl-tRNA synthetase editing domain-containing protein [Prolixibacteraceae bacterium]